MMISTASVSQSLPASSCTLYLDATGDPSWPAPFGKSKTNWYVISGPALQTDADYKARLEVDRILAKYVPDSEHRKWPPQLYELHYTDIIGGHKLFSHLQPLQRKALSDEIFDLIVSLKPRLFATAVNKIQLKYRYGIGAYPPKSLALRATIHRYSMCLNKNGMIGSVVLDEEEYRKDRELQTMTHEFRSHGVILRGQNYQPRYEDKLERVLNTITFTPSHMSPGIQLADSISKAVFSHFERGKSNRYNQLANLWNRDPTRVYEPSVVPKY